MAATLEIPMSLKNFTQVMGQLRQVQAALNGVTRASGGGMSVSPNGGSSRPGGGGGGGNGGGGGGTRTPPNFTRRLNTFVRSTRFGGGGVSPLVGRALDLVAPELGALAGPVGLLALGLTKAVSGLKDFVISTNQAANNFSSLRYGAGGGSAQGTGQLASIAASLGMDPSGLAGIVGNLQGAASGNGLAAAAASRLGLQLGPAGLFNLDGGKLTRTAITRLRAESPAQAQQDAALTGSTDLLRFRNKSQSDIDQMFKAGAGLGSAGAGATKSQERLSDSLGRLKISVDTLVTKLGGQAAGPASGVIGGLTNVLNSGKLGDIASRFLSGDAAGAFQEYRKNEGAPAAEQHPIVKAVNRNTAAVEAHTRAVQKQSALTTIPGAYGNHARDDFQGGGMGGLALQRMIAQKKALQLSPF